MKIKHTLLFAVISITLFISGVHSAAANDGLTQAKAHLANKDYKKAYESALKALKKAQSDVAVLLFLAEVEEYMGNQGSPGLLKSAAKRYEKVLTLKADNQKAKMALAKLYVNSLSKARIAKAEKFADELLKADPKSADANAVKGVALYKSKKTKQANTYIQKALKLDSGNLIANTMLAQKLIDSKKIGQAVAHISKVLKKHPKLESLRMNLVRIHLGRKQIDSAIKELKVLVKQNPSNFQYTDTLVTLYLVKKKPAEAKKIVKEAADAHPKVHILKVSYISFVRKIYGVKQAIAEAKQLIAKHPGVHILKFELGAQYMDAKQFKNAEALYRGMMAKHKDNEIGLGAQVQYALTLLRQGKVNEANEEVAKVIRKDTDNADALLVRGHIALSTGDVQNAIVNFQTVVRHHPHSIAGLQGLADAQLRAKRMTAAQETMRKAISVKPDSLALRLALVRLYLADGKRDKAKKVLVGLLKVNPKNLVALRTLFDIQVGTKDYAGAKNTVDLIKKYSPKNPLIHYYSGVILQAQGKHKEAIAKFETILRKTPTSHQPLVAVVRSYVALKQETKAILRVNRAIDKNPRSLPALTLLSQIFIKRGDLKNAGNALREAMKKNPKLPVGYSNLAEFYKARKNMVLAKARSKKVKADSKEAQSYNKSAKRYHDMAISTLERGVKAIPTSQTLKFLLANEYQERGKAGFAKAKKLYQQILAKNPNKQFAANNLAIILLTESKPGDVEKALELTKNFKYSGNPFLLDTAGWAYYKAGKLDDALEVLKRAVSKKKEVGEINYHIGMVYFKKKKLDLAKKHLKVALDSKHSFVGRDDAKTTHAKLSK